MPPIRHGVSDSNPAKTIEMYRHGEHVHFAITSATEVLSMKMDRVVAAQLLGQVIADALAAGE